MADRCRGLVEPLTGSMTELMYSLSDEQWHLISDLFPETPVGPQRGRPKVPPSRCV